MLDRETVYHKVYDPKMAASIENDDTHDSVLLLILSTESAENPSLSRSKGSIFGLIIDTCFIIDNY